MMFNVYATIVAVVCGAIAASVAVIILQAILPNDWKLKSNLVNLGTSLAALLVGLVAYQSYTGPAFMFPPVQSTAANPIIGSSASSEQMYVLRDGRYVLAQGNTQAIQSVQPQVAPMTNVQAPMVEQQSQVTGSYGSILDQKQMPQWLSTHVGGRPDQWHLVVENGQFNGWQFYTKDGNGPNTKLCPQEGRVDFGVWDESTQWWAAARIVPGQCTYARLNDPSSATTIDDGRWYPTSPSVSASASVQMQGVNVAPNTVQVIPTTITQSQGSTNVDANWLSANVGGPPQFWTNKGDVWAFRSTDGSLHVLKWPGRGIVTYGVETFYGSKEWKEARLTGAGQKTQALDSASYFEK